MTQPGYKRSSLRSQVSLSFTQKVSPVIMKVHILLVCYVLIVDIQNVKWFAPQKITLVLPMKNCSRTSPNPPPRLSKKTTVSQSCAAGWYISEAMHRPPSSDRLRSVIKLCKLDRFVLPMDCANEAASKICQNWFRKKLFWGSDAANFMIWCCVVVLILISQ